MASLPLAPHQPHNPPPPDSLSSNSKPPSQHSMSDDKVFFLSLSLNVFTLFFAVFFSDLCISPPFLFFFRTADFWVFLGFFLFFSGWILGWGS